jgi:ankyrin repeat protein
MADEVPGVREGTRTLPDHPSLDWLRKAAKHRLASLRLRDPAARLAEAQRDLAREYGFASWRKLKAHVDALGVEGALFSAARDGDVAALVALLDAHPDALLVRDKPYEHTLLHVAARHGRLAAVELLLARGIDPDVREKGDFTYPMHWAAAGGHLDVVRALAGAGGDVVGHGDDHELEVIGWASCWEGCDDDAHRAVVDFLVGRGARHHVFSAIALGLPDEVRRLIAEDRASLGRRMSRNEGHQTPLHFAVRMRRPDMAELLLELGADPFAVDDDGHSVAFFSAPSDADRAIMRAIVAAAPVRSTNERPRADRVLEVVAALALRDWSVAEEMVRGDASRLEGGDALRLVGQRGDAESARWLLTHGADPNARGREWDSSNVTPLHVAAGSGAADVVRALLAAGADPHVRDSRFESEPIGWAEHFGHTEAQRVLAAVATLDGL